MSIFQNHYYNYLFLYKHLFFTVIPLKNNKIKAQVYYN